MFGLGLGRLGLSGGGKSLAAQIMAMSPKLWLEPSVSGGYQDSAGTTALYAPGGGLVDPPVGLALDKSQGLALGAELVTNGDFSNGTTGWTKAAGVTIGAGVATFTAVDSSSALYRGVSVSAGKRYQFEFDLVVSIGSVQPVIFGDTASSEAISSGHKIYHIDAMAPNGNGGFRANAFTGTITNISVRELPGNHASQATSTARPVLSARKNLLLATATLATQNVTTVAGQYTIQFSGAGSVTASGTYAGVLTSGQTFTATAGTLTLTVAGSVTSAQLEAGSVATGYQSITDANTYDAAFPLIHKFDGVDDVHNVTFPSSLGSACTVITANRYAAPTILTAQTIGTSLAINATHAGKLVFDRALTGPETAIVTAWANKQGGL